MVWWPAAHPWLYRRQRLASRYRALVALAASWLAPARLCRRAFYDGYGLAMRAVLLSAEECRAITPGRLERLITAHMREYEDDHAAAIFQAALIITDMRQAGADPWDIVEAISAYAVSTYMVITQPDADLNRVAWLGKWEGFPFLAGGAR